MQNLEFKQITEINNDNLDIMTNWMYKWWGEADGYTFEGVKCYLQHSFLKDRLPKTYGLFHNGRIIRMFQFTYEDDNNILFQNNLGFSFLWDSLNRKTKKELIQKLIASLEIARDKNDFKRTNVEN